MECDCDLVQLAGFRLSWPKESSHRSFEPPRRRRFRRSAAFARKLPIIGKKLARRDVHDATGWGVSLSVPGEGALPSTPRARLSGSAVG